MPKSNANLALKGLDEMFSTEESRQEQKREQVQQIPIEELFPFKEHPFKVLDDEAMQRTVESVAQYGVLAPLIARPRPEGGYEIISGHRRQYAAKLAGLDTLPVIVRQMSDDGTVILMVDSNLQREHILPSERAFAYKMKLDAIKNQGARSDLTSTQVAQKLSVEKVGDDAGVSKDTIRRFIRLTNLIPELLDIDISGASGGYTYKTDQTFARTLAASKISGIVFETTDTYDDSSSQIRIDVVEATDDAGNPENAAALFDSFFEWNASPY